mgnify:CR=1 FL=1
MQGRTHNCGQLRLENAGEKVTLVGWFENIRKVSKNLGFVILRDFYGTTQIVVETEDLMEQFSAINTESTIEVTGTVRERSSKNPKLATGDIEVVPETVKVLGKCQYQELPFQINRSKEADENTRLKYRYLDLRNPEVKSKIVLRSKIVADLRSAMVAHDFMEITTPILTCSSPEGARDYLVPARKHPGKFYALPQAPQQFKQLLMASGFDRYFQIAPCFRDEDARADRSPGEFYQLDMEMAFANQEDVFAVLEDVLPPIFAKYGIYHEASTAPFKRIPYREAMEKYGSDKPDLRISLLVQDATEALADCGFEPFAGKTVKAVVAPDFKGTRKQIDKMCAEVEVISGQKAYWFKMDENGELAGGIAKFLQEKKDAVIEALGLKNGDFVALSAGTLGAAQKTAGVIRKLVGTSFDGYMKKECYEFCWVVDFPMYEIGEESGELEFCHNPFSMPNGGLEILQKAAAGEVDPLTITAYQYDLVCNGVELSREPFCVAVALHHRLAGKKVLTPEDLKGERLLMMRKGWSCYVDALRAELTEKYPEITIADFDFYNVDIFNRCENSNDMLLAIKSWESVHPLMKILPVEWDYKMPYGLLYAKDPSEKVEKLVRTVEGITK